MTAGMSEDDDPGAEHLARIEAWAEETRVRAAEHLAQTMSEIQGWERSWPGSEAEFEGMLDALAGLVDPETSDDEMWAELDVGDDATAGEAEA